jgi:ATP-dependent DNA helicase RecG
MLHFLCSSARDCLQILFSSCQSGKPFRALFYNKRLKVEMTGVAGFLPSVEMTWVDWAWIREVLKAYPEIEFSLEELADFFMVVLRVREITPQATLQVTPQASDEILRLLWELDKPLGRQEIQDRLGVHDRKHFRNKYLQPALEAGLIELSDSDKPNNPRQKYLLSETGRMLLGREEL